MALSFKSADINMLYWSSSRSIPLIMRLWISFSCWFLLSTRKSSSCFFSLLSEAALFLLLLGCALLLSPDIVVPCVVQGWALVSPLRLPLPM